MTSLSFEKTIRGEAIRVGRFEIVPIGRASGHAFWTDGAVSGMGSLEPLGLEIIAPEGTRSIDLETGPPE